MDSATNFSQGHSTQRLMVLAVLLPQSTSSSRPLLALHSLASRLFFSSQSDMSRANDKGKEKAARGNDHGLHEHSDWPHIAHRKSLCLIYGQFHSDVSSFQPAPSTALAAFGPRATVRVPPCPTVPLSRRRKDTVHLASGKAKMYGISVAGHRRCGTVTLARCHLPA